MIRPIAVVALFGMLAGGGVRIAVFGEACDEVLGG